MLINIMPNQNKCCKCNKVKRPTYKFPKCPVLCPPDATGRWHVSNFHYLRQETPNQNVSVCDVKKLDDFDVIIEQNELFITQLFEEAVNLRSMPLNQIGIWDPDFDAEGNVTNWEIKLGDYDDSAYHIYRITKWDECGNPIQFFATYVESGFQKGNDEQRPTAGYFCLNKYLE